jgi:hypothetical protein
MLSRFAFPVLFSVAVVAIFLLPSSQLSNTETPGNLFSGSNTLTCISDQLVFPKNASVSAEVSNKNNRFYLNLWVEGKMNRITFILSEQDVKEAAYELDDPTKNYVSFQYNAQHCTFTSDEFSNGMLMIHKYDTVQKIIAGSFEFMAYSMDCDELIRVTNGIFDVTYMPN